jgi:HSP20 family protein
MAKEQREDATGQGGGVGGILKGLADLVEKLGDLAEKGETLSSAHQYRAGENKREIKGVYGFSIKVGLGGRETRVEPFGNIRKDAATGRAVVQEIREPLVDVFAEEDHILIVAEMPGIEEGDIQLEFGGDILTLAAERGEKKYRKEIALPQGFARERATVSCNNGIVEVRCSKGKQ